MRGAGGRPLFANSGADSGLVLVERQAPPAARASKRRPPGAGVPVWRRRTGPGPGARRRRTPTASAGPGDPGTGRRAQLSIAALPAGGPEIEQAGDAGGGGGGSRGGSPAPPPKPAALLSLK